MAAWPDLRASDFGLSAQFTAIDRYQPPRYTPPDFFRFARDGDDGCGYARRNEATAACSVGELAGTDALPSRYDDEGGG
ncbi:MAG: hypothetical protein WD176_09095, partial [Pirellulales bacterium]